MTFNDDWVGARRVFILRLLAKVGAETPADVIFTALEHGGFARDRRAAYRADLEHLSAEECISADVDDALMITLTDRGRMAAEGRLSVPGVEQSRWRQGPG